MSIKHIEDSETHAEAVRLPLWKNVYEQMIAEGCDYGSTYHAEFFEESLKTLRDTMRFGLDLAKIRRALEHHGMYLTARGQNGNQFVIVPPESNADKLVGYQRAAIDALKRGVILGTNTRLDSLSDEQRRRHESTLEKLATRAALISRGVRKEIK
jgi:hypothetical protein